MTDGVETIEHRARAHCMCFVYRLISDICRCRCVGLVLVCRSVRSFQSIDLHAFIYSLTNLVNWFLFFVLCTCTVQCDLPFAFDYCLFNIFLVCGVSSRKELFNLDSVSFQLSGNFTFSLSCIVCRPLIRCRCRSTNRHIWPLASGAVHIKVNHILFFIFPFSIFRYFKFRAR